MRSFEFVSAAAVPTAQMAVAAHEIVDNTVYLAGGTTLLDLMKLDIMRPARVVDVHKINLKEIERFSDGRMRVGAMVTNTELARHPEISAAFPVLSQALLSGASTQLRNKATTAGNIMQRARCGYFRDGVSPCNKRQAGSGCAAIGGHNRNVHAVLGGTEHCIAAHPSDMCVAVAAIGATVEVLGPSGVRQIDFGDFHLLPGDTPWKEHALQPNEMITHLTLAPPLKHSQSAYLKLRDRTSYQFALASSAVILVTSGDRITEARIAMGGVGTKPWRARNAEAILKGEHPNREVFEQAAALAMEGAKSYGQNGFKIKLGQQAIVRNLLTLTGVHHGLKT
jgi:xanthine dehydrogenase YagS FAD-binding subunit